MFDRHRVVPCLLVFVAVIVLTPAPAGADWVSLRNGEHLRGVDLEKAAGGYRFTLASGEDVWIPAADFFHLEKSPAQEMVEFRGERVTLRRQTEVLAREHAQRLDRSLDDLELWARAAVARPASFAPALAAVTPVAPVTPAAPAPPVAPDAAEAERAVPDASEPGADVVAGLAARERVNGLETEVRLAVFLRALEKGRRAETRRLGARELGEHRTVSAVRGLVRAAIVDDHRSVRDASLASLRRLGDPNTAQLLAGALADHRPSVRTRASNALSLFPQRAVVPQIIATMRKTWVGFGRANIVQVTQRAYIRDYELVSGGTGFAIVEVADPVIATNLEGVALDVDVQRVELIAHLRALRKITGQDFGGDLAAWQSWSDQNPQK